MRDAPHWYDTQWCDEGAGPVVRPYTLTGGRTRPTHGALDLIARVRALPGAAADLPPEHAGIVELCRAAPVAVAEIAARCDLPVGVTRVLLADLLTAGRVEIAPANTPDPSILPTVLRGLHAL